MSEGYKKIELEDVKKGQRVQIAFYLSTHVTSHTGTVVSTDIEGKIISLGHDQGQFQVYLNQLGMPDIFLLEDAPKPKVVRTETVTITHYDDGTTTQTSVDEVPTVIKTRGQFEEYEDYLKQVVLKDNCGDYWTYQDGVWGWATSYGVRRTPWASGAFEESLPMTIVENVGD